MWIVFFSGILFGLFLSVFGYMGYRKYKEIQSRVPFKIRIEMVTRPLPAFVIEAQGDLMNQGEEVSYVLHLQDRTGGKISPILFKTEGKERTVDILEVAGPTLKVKKRERLMDWTRIVTLPAERIRFSHQGKRELNFSLQVKGAPVRGNEVFSSEQHGVGFVEVKEKLTDIYASVWYLVVGLRSDFPDHSALILERAAEFLVQESESWSSHDRSQIFTSFRDIAETDSPSISWEEACESYAVGLQSTADDDMRNDIMRLFYTLLMDEGGLKLRPETSLLVFYSLCIGMGMEMATFTRLVDRFILNNDLSDVPAGCMLGLHVGMDLKAVKARLMEEYKKWNPRVTHSDEKIRNRAKKMLELISTTRSALK